MTLALLFIIASTLSLSYRKGETFSYLYDSTVTTAANQESGDGQSMKHRIATRAIFKVLSVSAKGAYIQMNIKDVESIIYAGDESEVGQNDADSEESFSKPVYFTHNIDGSITDVVVAEDEVPDVVELKTAILYGLQTSLTTGSGHQYDQVSVIDPQGSHYEYFTSSVEGNAVVIDSHYTHEDFLAFAENETDEADLTLDTKSKRTIVGDKIVRSDGDMFLVMNKVSGTSNEDEIELVTVGFSSMSSFAQGNDEQVEFPYESVEAFLNERPNLRRVQKLHPSWYRQRQTRRKTQFVETQKLDGFSGCPGDIDVCTGFDRSWTAGNSNVGLRLSANANAGVKKGCKTESRSYAVGTHVGIDILILGKTVNAATGFAEYGQVNGSPLRNGVELTLFGHAVYQKNFPWIDCKEHTDQLINFSKNFSFSWSIMIYVVQIQFSVGISLSFGAQLSYKLCPQDLSAKCTLIPKGTATLYGGASASIAVAKAGIEIRGSISDYLDPTVEVDGGKCQVRFSMYNNFGPTDVSLVGWWQVRTIKMKKFIPMITWGSKHETTFWHHAWAITRSAIVEPYSIGAK